jgi:Asp-tRNA(Asn)/Glu-tRNA(Gln) amidotransferase A subunit family amidase
MAAIEQAELRRFLGRTERFRDGTDTPRQFLERCLAHLDREEPKVGAFAALNIDGARAAADKSSERWRAGRQVSPIDGMPMGIKDVIETADMPTQMGSPLFEGWHSHKDAASVAALRAAGAVVIGKTVTTEFAMSFPYGKTRNPHDLDRTPGGSSSGTAAAVGAGFISAGLGTQVIGSVLRPASFCGAFGFKPTVHALNRTGSHDYQSQSCIGVIAASLEDAWQVAYEIATRAGGDPGWPGLAGPDHLPRAKMPRQLALLETAGWASATEEAKSQLHTAVERIKAAGVKVLTRKNHAIVDAIEPDIADAMEFSMGFSDWEMRWFIRTLADRDVEKLSAPVRERFVLAEKMTLADYRQRLVRREEIRAGYEELANDCDGCITLMASGAAPHGLQSTGNPSFAVPASLLGTPALSLPVLSAEGLPLGLQFIGFANRDADAFSTASWLQALLGKAHDAPASTS